MFEVKEGMMTADLARIRRLKALDPVERSAILGDGQLILIAKARVLCAESSAERTTLCDLFDEVEDILLVSVPGEIYLVAPQDLMVQAALDGLRRLDEALKGRDGKRRRVE